LTKLSIDLGVLLFETHLAVAEAEAVGVVPSYSSAFVVVNYC